MFEKWACVLNDLLKMIVKVFLFAGLVAFLGLLSGVYECIVYSLCNPVLFVLVDSKVYLVIGCHSLLIES